MREEQQQIKHSGQNTAAKPSARLDEPPFPHTSPRHTSELTHAAAGYCQECAAQHLGMTLAASKRRLTNNSFNKEGIVLPLRKPEAGRQAGAEFGPEA